MMIFNISGEELKHLRIPGTVERPKCSRKYSYALATSPVASASSTIGKLVRTGPFPGCFSPEAITYSEVLILISLHRKSRKRSVHQTGRLAYTRSAPLCSTAHLFV